MCVCARACARARARHTHRSLGVNADATFGTPLAAAFGRAGGFARASPRVSGCVSSVAESALRLCGGGWCGAGAGTGTGAAGSRWTSAGVRACAGATAGDAIGVADGGAGVGRAVSRAVVCGASLQACLVGAPVRLRVRA